MWISEPGIGRDKTSEITIKADVKGEADAMPNTWSSSPQTITPPLLVRARARRPPTKKALKPTVS